MPIKRLIGFSDTQVGYEQTKQNLEFDGESVHSLVNGQSFGIGKFELLTLKELRARVSAFLSEGTDERFGSPNRVGHNPPERENVKDYMKILTTSTHCFKSHHNSISWKWAAQT